jgi:N-acetylglutamate synthase-like GNAT family acetyltransferase
MRQSSNELPASLLLVGNSNEVIGHARISAVLGVADGVFIESVVVAKHLRGQGYGRRVMEECERFSQSIGKNTLYLSTHDKEAFYRHLGYTSGPIVSPVTRISKLINPEQMVGLAKSFGDTATTVECTPTAADSKNEDVNKTIHCDQSPGNGHPLLCPAPAPAPPPPPPKLVQETTQLKVWLRKKVT